MKSNTRKSLTLREEDIKGESVKLKVSKDIHVDIYNCSVLIFTGEEAKKYSEFNRIGFDSEAGTINKEEYGDIVVLFKKNKPDFSTVAHEFTHATQMILHNISYHYQDKETDEPFAYLLGYLIEEFYKN